ncbi:MAG: hypothetical protein H6843_11390 [Rhodospirillaceae bacterium]|nr:hypothetical protein [Rhodospirillaceae bacterium]
MRDALMRYNLPGPPGLADHTMHVLGRRPAPQGPGGLAECDDASVVERQADTGTRRAGAAWAPGFSLTRGGREPARG